MKSTLRRIVETAHYSDWPFTTVQMNRDTHGRVTSCQHYYASFEEHIERMERYGPAAFEAYMAVSDSASESLRLTGLTESWAVAADFDAGLAYLCRPGQPLAPTCVIETSPERYHCLWQLDVPIQSDRLGRLAKAIASRLHADMSFARANQTVRLPYFMNQKRGCPVIVRNDLSSGIVYKADFLWEACDGDLYEAGVAQASPKINHTRPFAAN